MHSRILHGKTILASGDFGQVITNEALKELVEENDGAWLTAFDDGVTHLVTTIEEWEKKSAAVQEALAVNAHVVNFDWLQNSVISPISGKPHREDEYGFEEILKSKAKAKDKNRKKENHTMAAAVDGFMSGKKAARDDLHSGTSSNPPATYGNVSMSRIGRMLHWIEREDEALASQALNPPPPPQLLAPTPPPKTGRKRAGPSTDGAAPKKRIVASTKSRASVTPQAGAKPKRSKLSKDDLKLLRAATSIRRRKGPGDGIPASELDRGRPSPRTREQAAAEARTWREQTRNALIAKANAEWPFPDQYHLYRDESGRVAAPPAAGAPAPFMAVTLVKPILKLNQTKTVYLRLYESDAEPRRYAAFKKKIDEKGSSGKVLAPEASEWEVAWKAFTDEFRALTGVKWSEREKAMAGSGRQVGDQEYYFGNFLITV